MSTILITGSEGLIGASLGSALAPTSETRRFDVRVHDRLDIRDRAALATAVEGCVGIIHLAAVSRVIWGERDPQLCWSTNVDGTRNVLDAAQASAQRPWVIVASSREVYGDAKVQPVEEDAPLQPLNVYGRSKVAAERLAHEACTRGVRAAIVRLSNVYGSAHDHADRVIPHFIANALNGDALRVEGSCNTFDFTHVDDTVRGIMAVARAFEAGAVLPAIHFVTGTATTLEQLADLVIRRTASTAVWHEAPSRAFDVARFRGDPARAKRLLNWAPQVTLEDGIARLVSAMSPRSELS